MKINYEKPQNCVIDFHQKKRRKPPNLSISNDLAILQYITLKYNIPVAFVVEVRMPIGFVCVSATFSFFVAIALFSVDFYAPRSRSWQRSFTSSCSCRPRATSRPWPGVSRFESTCVFEPSAWLLLLCRSRSNDVIAARECSRFLQGEWKRVLFV